MGQSKSSIERVDSTECLHYKLRIVSNLSSYLMKLKKNKLEASTGREDTGETEIRTTEKLDKTKS